MGSAWTSLKLIIPALPRYQQISLPIQFLTEPLQILWDLKLKLWEDPGVCSEPLVDISQE